MLLASQHAPRDDDDDDEDEEDEGEEKPSEKAQQPPQQLQRVQSVSGQRSTSKSRPVSALTTKSYQSPALKPTTESVAPTLDNVVFLSPAQQFALASAGKQQQQLRDQAKQRRLRKHNSSSASQAHSSLGMSSSELSRLLNDGLLNSTFTTARSSDLDTDEDLISTATASAAVSDSERAHHRSSASTSSKRRSRGKDPLDDDEGALSGADEPGDISAATSSLIARYRQEAMGALRNAAASAGLLQNRLTPLAAAPLAARSPLALGAPLSNAAPIVAPLVQPQLQQEVAPQAEQLPQLAAQSPQQVHQQTPQSPQYATQQTPPLKSPQQMALHVLGESASAPVLSLPYPAMMTPHIASATSSVAEYLQVHPTDETTAPRRRQHHRSPSADRRQAREMRRQEQLSTQLSQERERNEKLQADLRSLRQEREASEVWRAGNVQRSRHMSPAGMSPALQAPLIPASALLSPSYPTPRSMSKLLHAQQYASSHAAHSGSRDDAQARSRAAAFLAHSDTELGMFGSPLGAHSAFANGSVSDGQPVYPSSLARSGSAVAASRARSRSRSSGRPKQKVLVDALSIPSSSPLVAPPPKVDAAQWARLTPLEQRNLFAEHMVHQSSYLQQQNLLQIHQLEQQQLARQRQRQRQQYPATSANLEHQWAAAAAAAADELDLDLDRRSAQPQRSLAHSASMGALARQQPLRHSKQLQQQQAAQMPTAATAARHLDRAYSAAALPVYRPATAAAFSASKPLQPQTGGWM